MAYVNLGQVIYPIGAIFASASSTSPSSMFGGTWSQITGDACLMAGTAVGNAGSKKITIENMPRHNHPLANDLGCGWQANANTSDRLFYGRYTQARPISDFGHAAYQGGGKIICLTPTDVTCGNVLPSKEDRQHRGDASCVTSKTSKSKLVQVLKQFVHSQLEQYINLLTQQVQPVSMAEDGHLSQMADSLDRKGLGIILAERMSTNSLLRKCQAIATPILKCKLPAVGLLMGEMADSSMVFGKILLTLATMPHTTTFPHIEHATAGIELPNILGGVLC